MCPSCRWSDRGAGQRAAGPRQARPPGSERRDPRGPAPSCSRPPRGGARTTESRDAAELLDQPLAPLHDDHALLERVLEVEVGEVECPAPRRRAGGRRPRAAAAPGRGAPGQHERRAGHRAPHAQPGWPRPCVSDVLPAPSGPDSTTRSPGRRAAARRAPERPGGREVGQQHVTGRTSSPGPAARSRARARARRGRRRGRRSSASPGSASARRRLVRRGDDARPAHRLSRDGQRQVLAQQPARLALRPVAQGRARVVGRQHAQARRRRVAPEDGRRAGARAATRASRDRGTSGRPTAPAPRRRPARRARAAATSSRGRSRSRPGWAAGWPAAGTSRC